MKNNIPDGSINRRENRWISSMKIKKHSLSSPDSYSKPANYYDRNTRIYLENNQNPSDFIDEFLGLLRQGSDKKKAEKRKLGILDLGCGPGVNAAYMHSKNFHVVGTDLSKKMIGYAKRNYPQIEFLLGDMAELSFPSDSFDGILASYSLIHLPKETTPPVLAKLYEILRPGGIVYISVQSGKSSQGLYAHPLTPGEPVFLNVFSKKEIFNLLSEYGFDVVSQHEKMPRGKVFDFTKLYILAKKPA